jgi:hypothetical protein
MSNPNNVILKIFTMMKPCTICLLLIAAFLPSNLAWSQDEEHPKLPSGPDGPGSFGAYYAHLKYTPEWDKPWRVDDHPDVVVRFDEGGHKFVFWRGTSYIPCWVTDTDVWYTNEFVERRGAHSPNTEGCVEPMSDKQCRFSHVRIIESNDARVVVHWRYAPVDVRYEHPFIDQRTGWFDWVDEYYVIYPDATGIREINVQSNGLDKWIEFQEAIVVNQPGTLPDDNIELGAVSIANMNGEHITYYWNEEGGPEFNENPPHSNIFKVNLKGSLQPFALVAPPKGDGNLITSYEGHGLNSHFNWWDHWPVSMDASDGRGARSAEKPSHSSLCHFALPGNSTAQWEPYEESENKVTKLMMHGMTEKKVEEIVPIAKSWLFPCALMLSSSSYESLGYDPPQMAYVIEKTDPESASPLTFTLEASEESPLVNPAFVIRNWGNREVELILNGTVLKRGTDFRYGIEQKLEGTDLVVWIRKESSEPVSLSLKPI